MSQGKTRARRYALPMDSLVASLLAELDRTRRGLLLVALLGEGTDAAPIVVGGFAVEAWTRGGYTTSDIDLVCRRPQAARKRLIAMGFRLQKRHLLHDGLGLAVEIPGTVLDEGRDAYDRLVRWEIDGHTVDVLAVEDVLVDRLADEVHRGVTSERENVLRLMMAWWDRIDWAVVEARAAREAVGPALAEARAWIQARVEGSP